jgi:hypothetical protein
MKRQNYLKIFISIILLGNTWVQAQKMGDTLRVQAFTFESTTRDTLISFPNPTDFSFEKILLK